MNKSRINLLIEILNDPISSITEKDDAAIQLGQFDDDEALYALISFGKKKNKDETVLNSCGESIGEIWTTRNIFYQDIYSTLSGTTRYGIFYVIKHDKPEWIQQYRLDEDSFE